MDAIDMLNDLVDFDPDFPTSQATPSDWEINFIESVRRRVEEEGRPMTEAQETKLREIYEKVYG